jgi:hypothetical protein
VILPQPIQFLGRWLVKVDVRASDARDPPSVQLLRERVKECYKMEGVNHLQNCKEVSLQTRALSKGLFFGKPSKPTPFFGLPKPAPPATHSPSNQSARRVAPPRQEVNAYLESIKNVGVHRINSGRYDTNARYNVPS